MSFLSPQELLDRHGSSIRAVLSEIHASPGGTLEPGELFNLGVEGMLDAAKRFDPTLGVQFWTFAYPRVRGAMIDAIRQSMPLPAGLYRRLAREEAAVRATAAGTRAHEEAAQRLAEVTEAAGLISSEVLAIARGETLGVDEGELADASLDALEAGSCSPEDDASARVMRVDQRDATEQLEMARCGAAIHRAMRQLTVEQRMIVRGFYFEDRGLFDLGAELGISKSWACRLHTRALRTLKELLACDWGYEPERPWAPRARDERSDWIAVLLEGAASDGVEAIETEDADTTEVANAA